MARKSTSPTELTRARIEKKLSVLDKFDALFNTVEPDIETVKAQGMTLVNILQLSVQLSNPGVDIDSLVDQASNVPRILVVLRLLREHPRPEKLEFLKSNLGNTSWWVRNFAVSALASLKNDEAKAALETAYSTTNDEELKEWLTVALADFDYPEITELLRQQLNDPETRLQAMKALVRCEGGEANAFLLEAFADKDDAVSEAAYQALRQRRDFRVIPGLIEMLERALMARRRNAAALLGQYKATAAIPALCHNLLTSRNKKQRETICQALGRIGDTGSVPTLIEIIEPAEESSEVLAAACAALGKLDDRRALEPLLQLTHEHGKLKHRSSQVQVAAANAARHCAAQEDAQRFIELLAYGQEVQRVLAPWLVKHKVLEALGPLQAAVAAASYSDCRKVLEKAVYRLSQAADKQRQAESPPPIENEANWENDIVSEDPCKMVAALSSTKQHKESATEATQRSTAFTI